MIGRHRIGLLGQALLMLGVVDMPPPREPELDMAAVEKVMRELVAAGLEPADVHAAAGSPQRFIETAQKCLSMQAALAAHGQPSVDVGYLLARHDDLVRGTLPTRPALHGFEGLQARPARIDSGPFRLMLHRERPAAPLPAKCEPSSHRRRWGREARQGARPEQAAARKVRSAKKAKRGW